MAMDGGCVMRFALQFDGDEALNSGNCFSKVGVTVSIYTAEIEERSPG
jgi:hypothetical protein